MGKKALNSALGESNTWRKGGGLTHPFIHILNPGNSEEIFTIGFSDWNVIFSNAYPISFDGINFMNGYEDPMLKNLKTGIISKPSFFLNLHSIFFFLKGKKLYLNTTCIKCLHAV